MITPQEIRGHTFSKSLRGFEVNEVTAFLDSLAGAWERLEDQCNRQKAEIEQLREQLSRMRNVEGALGQALQDAEAVRNTLLAAAQREADQILAGAQQEAQRMALQRAELLGQLKSYFSAQLARISEYERIAVPSSFSEKKTVPSQSETSDF